jgi:pilus assembly protein CpaB
MAEQSMLQAEGLVVAATNISLASTINPDQVVVVPWPRRNIPPDALRDPKLAVGRMVWRDFLRGEPIVESKLVTAGKMPGIMALKVPPGMRAFSVLVNEVVGVGGFIIPDSRGDVVVTTSLGPHVGQVSKIVLEDIQVLAAGQVVEEREKRAAAVNTVTLAVTPEDAEKLALAVHDGKIVLVLRNFIDNAVVTTTGVDKGRLLASRYAAPPAEAEARPRRAPAKKAPQAAKPPPPPPRAAHDVLVIRGTKRSVDTFQE